MFTRKNLEKQEDKLLAPYAMRSKDSEGRAHSEQEHDYRTCYQRDKDRIIHSTAFRRLEYKTQVFVNHEGDYYRTRLTHTLEVAQIAKAIARALRLNEDLTEAIALAHDLGHTPFGHSGEEALNHIMKRHGGFNHNLQGLRVVDQLEESYPDFPGLNLSYEVREGIIKHTTTFDKPRLLVPFERKGPPLLETQVVDVADEIAYDNHDLDDGITSNLLKEDDLLKEVELWRKTCKALGPGFPKANTQIRKCQIIRALINVQVTDVIAASEENIKKFKVKAAKDARGAPHKLIGFGRDMGRLRKPLREFLLNNLYQHYRVVRMSNKAYRFIHELFKVYMDKPEQLPPTTLARLRRGNPRTAICDYIAGMTDRYALDEYKKFFEPYEKV